MLHNILIVYLKEMKEVLRDRKSLIFMLLLPTIILPVVMSLAITFVTRAEKKSRSETLAFAIFGVEHLPELAEGFDQEKGFHKVEIGTPNDIESAIAAGKIEFAIVIPDVARQRIADGNQVAVRLCYDDVSVTSKVKERAGKIIRKVSDGIRSNRLAGLGLDSPRQQQGLLNPIVVEERGAAEMRGVRGMREMLGERLGGMLPYLFIIFCFVGAMSPAIDLGAGEKERGTLETLLLAPIPRSQLVLGKFLVIATTGITSALLSVSSIGLTLAVKVEALTGELRQVIESVSVLDLALIAAMLIPTAAIFASLLLSISIYARTFREASTYCGPLNLVVLFPAFIAVLPGVELNWVWAMVPITNISLATKELVKGTMDYPMLIAILGSSIVIAAGLLFFCTKWFEREAVLFRQ
ncbi:MAG TPA: ABC transporter permease [Sedimentisphaerales bacterium]|nr:ABC transporter permease [Sedimentisphaerales bacterium]